ncbi:PaaI family thioesterase [Rheinheimera faecalis]|uniref:PaaI family thioesterase n=1 Tax=Rheinheimera faecalis TaxID=2901141 RepID=UPI001E489CF5|nr:PaaI family thioesterase [Rheinheimera faecalis]
MTDATLPVLSYLQKLLAGELTAQDHITQLYPTAISQTLKFNILQVAAGEASLMLHTDPKLHGNQQGTVHGGLLAELADAAIGTAHSTLMQPNETFTSIDLRIQFFRPVWQDKLTAVAKPVQSGKTVTHYECMIYKDDGKVAAKASGIVMTLRGAQAKGR